MSDLPKVNPEPEQPVVFKSEAQQVLRDPVLVLAFGFGSGLVPKAPGTAGSLLALLLMPLLAMLSVPAYLLLLSLVIVAGVFICGYAAKALGVHDHGGIVWDEFAGLWLTLLFCPPQWLWWLLGFALFRFFDIVKPWPISWLDKHCGGGLGIMIDDLVAGVFAAAVLQTVVLVARWWMGV
ncbi:MAG: phosphatidylglycerophosphatase A [Porticoccaceae bacterium]